MYIYLSVLRGDLYGNEAKTRERETLGKDET